MRPEPRRAVALLATAAAAAALASCGGGNDDRTKQALAVQNRQIARDRATVREAIRNKQLPPVSIKMFDKDGLRVNFTGGPGAQDVVKQNGKPLAFDLNQNGRIDKSERRITERRLHDAVMKIIDTPPPKPGQGQPSSS
jgi:hypothetical protein